MSSIKRNIVANLLGGAWITALTLIVTPLQVNLLGIEAYGLIGFIATLQIVFGIFDLGLSSTLTREIATDSSREQTRTVDLVRTASTIYWSFAVLIGVGLAWSTPFIAEHWFNATALSVVEIEQSLYAITIFLALRWPVALYVGVLTGLQRMDVLNLVKISCASLRLLGGIAVLVLGGNLQLFLWWTVLTAVVEVVVHYAACRWVHPLMPWRFGVSLQVIRSVWSFSLSMSAITVLALIVSQLDRLVVSKLLSLDELGSYSIAYSAAAVASLVISAISSAMLPSFAAAYAQRQAIALQRRYDSANRVLLFSVGFAVFPMIFFGEFILSIWIGAAASSASSRPLALIAAGFWLSAALSNAYSLSIASGHPGLPLRLSALTAVPYALGLYLLTEARGVDGAALAWLLLNLCYVVVLVPMVTRRLLPSSSRHWMATAVLPFAGLGFATFALSKFLLRASLANPESNMAQATALLVSIALYAAIGYYLLGSQVQSEIATFLRLRSKQFSQSRP